MLSQVRLNIENDLAEMNSVDKVTFTFQVMCKLLNYLALQRVLPRYSPKAMLK